MAGEGHLCALRAFCGEMIFRFHKLIEPSNTIRRRASWALEGPDEVGGVFTRGGTQRPPAALCFAL